jgi:hypothetical protein
MITIIDTYKIFIITIHNTYMNLGLGVKLSSYCAIVQYK